MRYFWLYIIIAIILGVNLGLCIFNTSQDAKFEAMCEKKGMVGIKTISGQNMCIETVYQEAP